MKTVTSLLNAADSQQLVLLWVVFLFCFLQLIALFYRWTVFLSRRHCERSVCVYRLVLDCEPVESVSGCLFLNTEVIAKQ